MPLAHIKNMPERPFAVKVLLGLRFERIINQRNIQRKNKSKYFVRNIMQFKCM